MNYNFRKYDDLGIRNIPGSSFGLIFDGTDLEKQIEGFQTISVSGRGLLPRSVNLKSVSGTDGKVFSYSNMPERVIGVKYLLSAGSSEELRRKYSELNMILHGKAEKEIKFKDDLDYSFYGSLSGINEGEESSNEMLGEFFLICSKPFKYSYEKGVMNGEIPADPYSIKVHSNFTFPVSVAAGSVTFSNSLGDSVSIGPVVVGQYSLKFGDKVEVFENGIRKMALLSITEAAESFRILTGVTYTVSNGAPVTGVYRVLRL